LPKFPAPHKRLRRPAINEYTGKLRSTCPDFTEICMGRVRKVKTQKS